MTEDQAPRTSTDGGYETEPVLVADDRWAALGDVWTIGRTEYRLAVKNRWAVALTGIFAAFSLGLLTFSGSSVGPEGAQRILGSLTVLAVYLVPLAALAFGYDAIVGAEDEGWLQALFALPVARWRVAVGAYVGRSIALASAVIIGFGISGVILARDVGIGAWPGFIAFLLGATGLALVFLAIAVMVSTIAKAKTHALGGVLLVWAWFVLVHDLLALGVIAAFQLPDLALEAMVVTNPAGVFRVLVLNALDASGDAGFASVMAATGLSPVVLGVAMVAWIAVPLGLAAVLIDRRRV